MYLQVIRINIIIIIIIIIWIGFVCGVVIPYSTWSIMQVGLLGSKVIKGVLLQETLG